MLLLSMKIILILAGFHLLSGPSAFAHPPDSLWVRPNTLRTNLLSPLSVFYEHAFTRRFTLRSSIRGWDFHVNAVKDTRFIHATLEAKFYISKIDRLMSKVHPSGFFLVHI